MVNLYTMRSKCDIKSDDVFVFDTTKKSITHQVVISRQSKARSASSPSCSSPPGGFKRQDSTSGGSLKDIRLVVLGSGKVGKSALIRKFLYEEFPPKYIPTVEDCYRHIVQLPDGRLHNIEIVDTAGLHQFPAMRNLRVSTGHAFVVVYAIDDSQSFTEAKEFIELIHSLKGITTVPIVLVGTKADRQKYREVSVEDALALADKYGCSTEEISSLENSCIDFIFGDVLAQTVCENTKCKRSSSLTDQYSLRISLAIMKSVNRKNEIRKLHNQDRRCTIL